MAKNERRPAEENLELRAQQAKGIKLTLKVTDQKQNWTGNERKLFFDGKLEVKRTAPSESGT